MVHKWTKEKIQEVCEHFTKNGTLEEAIASAQKIEMSKTKKKRMKEDKSSGHSSSDSDDDVGKKKK